MVMSIEEYGFRARWCREKGVSPFDDYWWDRAGEEFLKVLEKEKLELEEAIKDGATVRPLKFNDNKKPLREE